MADTEHLYGLSKQDNTECVALHKVWGHRLHETLHDVKVVVVDANLNVEDLAHVCAAARQRAVDIWLEPVSLTKSLRLVNAGVVAHARYMSPNENEAIVMAKHLQLKLHGQTPDEHRPNEHQQQVEWINKDNVGQVLCEILQAARTIQRSGGDNDDDGHERTVFVTRGDRGVSAYHYKYDSNSARLFNEGRGNNGDTRDSRHPLEGQQHFKTRVVGPAQVRNTCGAGDCFAGVCAGWLSVGSNVDDSVKAGMKVARKACMSEACVPSLSDEQDAEGVEQGDGNKNDGATCQHQLNGVSGRLARL